MTDDFSIMHAEMADDAFRIHQVADSVDAVTGEARTRAEYEAIAETILDGHPEVVAITDELRALLGRLDEAVGDALREAGL